MSIVEEKLQELNSFQQKWGTELLQELGLRAGHALTVSFDSNVELEAAPDLAPLLPGFYAYQHDLTKTVEVTGVDVRNGLVLLDNGASVGAARIQVISRRLFEELFIYVDPTPVTLGG